MADRHGLTEKKNEIHDETCVRTTDGVLIRALLKMPGCKHEHSIRATRRITDAFNLASGEIKLYAIPSRRIAVHGGANAVADGEGP